MLRRIAHIAFYLLLQLCGEEFEGVVVDPEVLPQYSAQQIGVRTDVAPCAVRRS
jgi:hypothetical protein